MKRRRRTSALVKDVHGEKEDEEQVCLCKENEELRAKIELLEMESLQKQILDKHVSYLEFVLDELREEAEQYNEAARSVLASNEFDRCEDQHEEGFLDDAPSSMSSLAFRRNGNGREHEDESTFPAFY